MSTENAAVRVPRLLTMVPWLVNRQGVDIDSAAADLGITVEQLHADLELLFMCGYGSMTDELIDVQTEDGRIFISNADTIAQPLRLDRTEALTLMVGLRALANAEGVTDYDVIERTLAKLEEAAGSPTPASRVKAVIDDQSATATRALISDALKRHKRLHLRYLVPGRDETTERDVDPMRVLNLDGHWYLEGWCHRAEDTRIFRLDRIEAIEELDVDGTPPAAATTRELTAGVFIAGEHDLVVGLHLQPGWEWVAEYYPVETREAVKGGGLEVTLRASDTGWVRRLALRSGGGVAVTEPAQLAAEIHAVADAALAAYDSSADAAQATGEQAADATQAAYDGGQL